MARVSWKTLTDLFDAGKNFEHIVALLDDLIIEKAAKSIYDMKVAQGKQITLEEARKLVIDQT